jgi:hypothetical protein
MKNRFQFLLILLPVTMFLPPLHAQITDSLLVNLYTDSLKRGSFNYINIDGRSVDGKYLPLDTAYLEFSSPAGTFYGNSLYLPPDIREEEIEITVVLKQNRSVSKKIMLPIKRSEASGPLPTEEEFYRNSRKKKRAVKKSGKLLCIFQELGQPNIC